MAALTAVRDSQTQVASALTRLAAGLSRVLSAVTKAAQAAATGPTSGAGASSSSRGTTARSGGAAGSAGSEGSAATGAGGSAGASGAQRSATSSGGPSSGGASTNPATRVAADHVAILQDEATVTQAQADLTGATLKAPISGVVGQVNLAAGQAATSGSGIVIVGAGAAQVTVDVPLADMPLIRSGLSAKVAAAGAPTTSDGFVGTVSLLPTATSGSSPSYPATVVVTDPPTSMAAGSTVTVSITVASVPSALRVPVSALSGVTGGVGTATVLSGGSTASSRVEVGAVGGGWAQVLGGLSQGAQVVLADPSVPLPSTGFAGLRGLRTGGGFAPGGFNRGGTGGAPRD